MQCLLRAWGRVQGTLSGGVIRRCLAGWGRVRVGTLRPTERRANPACPSPAHHPRSYYNHNFMNLLKAAQEERKAAAAEAVA